MHFRPKVYALLAEVYALPPKVHTLWAEVYALLWSFCTESIYILYRKAHTCTCTVISIYIFYHIYIYVCLSVHIYIYIHIAEKLFKKYKHFVNIYLSIYIYMCIDICGSDSYMGCGFGRSDRENERESERGDSVKHFAVTTLSCCYV